MPVPVAPPDASAEVSLDSLSFPLATSDRGRIFEATGAELEGIHEKGVAHGMKVAAGIGVAVAVVLVVAKMSREG